MRYIFFIFSFLLSHLNSQAQDYDQYCDKAITAVEMLQRHHVEPIEVNNAFSGDIFKDVIELLDPYGLYFLKKDFDSLRYFYLLIDDELKGKTSCGFLHQLIPLYKKRILASAHIVEQITASPLNFNKDQQLTFGTEDTTIFASDSAALKERWEKWLKYLALEKMVGRYSGNHPQQTPTSRDLVDLEPWARQELKSRFEHRKEHFLNNSRGYENYIALLYLNTVISRFDPHSQYFLPKDKERFEGELSREEKSFGFQLEENNGKIIISRLVPGGPAWRSGLLHQGSIVSGIKWPNKKIFDFSTKTLSQAEYELYNSVSDTIVLHIVQGVAETLAVTLVKESIRADENIIKSFILESENNIGYISLPGFYTEFENENGLGCAHDIAQQLIKMKNEGLQGLILDLRYNGGGAMKEAIDLAGIFIDIGPVSILKGRGDKPITLKDWNRGAIYKEPLVILVNSSSASASEIFAAAMQDYQRAVILGTPTFGKATGQTILPMDTTYNPDSGWHTEDPKLGYIKITDSRFYRVNKQTHQRKGVIPDITLPVLTNDLTYHESEYSYALNADTIIKKVYMPDVFPLPLDQIKKLSEERIHSDSTFNAIAKYNNKSKAIKEEVPLTIQWYIENFPEPEVLPTDKKKTNIYTVKDVGYDSSILQLDSYTAELNKILAEKIIHDIYIEEAVNIIHNLIQLNK